MIENDLFTPANRRMLRLINNGGTELSFENTENGETWINSVNSGGSFVVSRAGTGGSELKLTGSGRLIVGPSGFAALDVRHNGNVFIAGMLTESSDRYRKENYQSVDYDDVLKRLGELEVTTWNYKHDDPAVRHMGPVAQDFRQAFELGVNDTTIAASDKIGVALAAIKALDSKLNNVLKAQDSTTGPQKQIETLAVENEQLHQRLDELETALEALLTNSNK